MQRLPSLEECVSLTPDKTLTASGEMHSAFVKPPKLLPDHKPVDPRFTVMPGKGVAYTTLYGPPQQLPASASRELKTDKEIDNE